MKILEIKKGLRCARRKGFKRKGQEKKFKKIRRGEFLNETSDLVRHAIGSRGKIFFLKNRFGEISRHSTIRTRIVRSEYSDPRVNPLCKQPFRNLKSINKIPSSSMNLD